MRILHAIHDYLPRHHAGSELYVASLAAWQRGAGHDARVLCAEYDPARRHGSRLDRQVDGVPVAEIANNWEFRSVAEAWEAPALAEAIDDVLGTWAPDVVHVHNLVNLSFALPRAARARGAAVVGTVHDFTLACASGGQRVHLAERHVCHVLDLDRCARCFGASPFFAQMRAHLDGVGGLRRVLRLLATGDGAPAPSAADLRARLRRAAAAAEACDVLVAPSAAVAEDLRRFGIAGAAIEVSDYGFPPLGEVARRPRRGPLRAGYVGTVAWHKGVHVLVEAVRLVPRGVLELTVHGDLGTFPDYARALRDQAAEAPVSFAGGFTAAARASVYAGLDVLVVPSLWPENSPLVIHEAFQAGVPVVAARVGGIPALVGEGGLLYEPFRPDALAAHLAGLAGHPARLEALAAARPRVKPLEEDAREWEARYARARARLSGGAA